VRSLNMPLTPLAWTIIALTQRDEDNVLKPDRRISRANPSAPTTTDVPMAGAVVASCNSKNTLVIAQNTPAVDV